jgi:hypothetical protein
MTVREACARRFLRPPRRRANYELMRLTDEMTELVHDGSRPVPLRDRNRYFELVRATLSKLPLLTNACVMDAVRQARREVLRPAAA